MKKRVIAGFMPVIMTAALFAGCGSKDEQASSEGTGTQKEESTDGAEEASKGAAEESEASGESIVSKPTELTYIFGDGDEGAKASMNEIVNRFNEKYADVTVTIEPGNGGAYSEFLKTKDSVGEFPDIMEMRDTAVYVRAGKLEPLSDEIVSLFKTTILISIRRTGHFRIPPNFLPEWMESRCITQSEFCIRK